MARTCLRMVLAFLLVFSPAGLIAQPPPGDAEVLSGMKQVDDGDYDRAILTLDNAARRLAGDPAKAADLSQAYLYLGIAYIGKGHEAAARAKFREALAQIKDLTLSPEKFPPKVIDAFEAAKQEAANAPAAPRPRRVDPRRVWSSVASWLPGPRWAWPRERAAGEAAAPAPADRRGARFKR